MPQAKPWKTLHGPRLEPRNPRDSAMRAAGAAIALLLAMALPIQAQQGGAPMARPQTNAAAPAPAIGCFSLANLRMLLRGAKDDPAAAIPIIKDPKSDLGCSVLDRSAVTGIADHVVLNGRAYDCVGLQHTSLCNWVVAGSVTPAAVAPPREAPAGASTAKGRR